MKKVNVLLLAALLLLGGGFAACNDGTKESPGRFDLSFTEYPLNSPGSWNLDYSYGAGNPKAYVTLMNSDEELQKLLAVENEYPPIDFSTHTLVLINGIAGNTIDKKAITNVRQLSTDRYELDVEITLGAGAAMTEWCIAVLTEKLGADTEIEPNVIIKYW